MEHIGIDIHKRESQICILTPEGEIIERRIQSTRDRFTAVFAARARAWVLGSGPGMPTGSAPTCRSSRFRPSWRPRSGPLLAVWEQLTAHLAVADAANVETAATNPVVQRLTTAPGVGPLIATAFVATLG